jgi:transcriptional regulator with XRE-family HTH domain
VIYRDDYRADDYQCRYGHRSAESMYARTIMTESGRNHRLRALRIARGWTQQQAADAIADTVAELTGGARPSGLDAQYIAKLERGGIRWPNEAYREALRTTFGVAADTDLGLNGIRNAHDAETHPDAVQVLPAPPGELYGVAQSGTQPWQLMDALTRSNISDETIALMERAVFDSATRYPSTPPRLLLPLILDQISRLHTALVNTQSLRILRRCVQLTGILTGLAGNLFLDIGNPLQAASFFDLGRTAGREAEDDGLTAWVLTTQSIGPFFAGSPGQATELLEHAAHLIAKTGNKRREAWVAAMAARAHAAHGNHTAALDFLDRSSTCLQAADDASGVDFFDSARFDGIAGSCHLRLGDTATSARMLGTAIERRAPTDVKGVALLVFDLAECKIVDGEIDEACHLATSALDLASEAIVRPIADRAKAIHHDLGPWHDLRPVEAFTERLRESPAILPAQRG